MSISASALTLAQYALQSNDPLVIAVTFSLIDNGCVIGDVPFINKATLIASGVRFEGSLPSVNWAQINSEGVTTSGTPTPFQESAYLIRNNIDVDKVLVLDQNQIADPRAIQLAAYMKGVAYEWNHVFINNNHVTGNANAPVGLRARIDNYAQYGLKSAQKVNAGGVDLTQAAATAATANAFIEYLDQLLWSVDSPDGNGVVLYMNEVMKRRLAFALRLMGTSGGLATVKDQFDRTIEMYKGAVIRDVGYKADQSTRIITTTETSAGVDGSSTYTSIYAANYGEMYLGGWQFEALQARDLGLMENGVISRTFVDWAGGLFSANNRSMARLYGIKLA